MNPYLAALSAAAPLVLCADLPVLPPANLSFRPVKTEIGDAGDYEARRVFTSPEQYEAYFDRRSPAEVDWNLEWVVFYSAGVQPTGGYHARILDIQSTEGGRSLMITTSLESPGPGCVVPEVLTRPYAMAKLRRPAKELGVARFHRADLEVDCVP